MAMVKLEIPLELRSVRFVDACSEITFGFLLIAAQVRKSGYIKTLYPRAYAVAVGIRA
jgi:hypothetical protein